MARCKCKICGTQLDTTTAYKITDKSGKHKYYCSASEFEAEETRKKKVAADKDKVYQLICDILGVKEIINTILFKEWQIWLKVADDAKIGSYLEENKDYLTAAISRLSGTEFAKIRYVSAVLKNGLGDFKPKATIIDTPKVVVDMTMYDTMPSNTKNRRRGLADLEDEI